MVNPNQYSRFVPMFSKTLRTPERPLEFTFISNYKYDKFAYGNLSFRWQKIQMPLEKVVNILLELLKKIFVYEILQWIPMYWKVLLMQK